MTPPRESPAGAHRTKYRSRLPNTASRENHERGNEHEHPGIKPIRRAPTPMNRARGAASKRWRKCSINSVVPIADKIASSSTHPSPKTGFTASFAKAPPVKGSPPIPWPGSPLAAASARASAGPSWRSRPRRGTARLSPAGDGPRKRTPPRGCRHPRRKPHADHRDQESHLAHARIREHELWSRLGDPDRDPIESTAQPHRRQWQAKVRQPHPERQEADQREGVALTTAPLITAAAGIGAAP